MSVSEPSPDDRLEDELPGLLVEQEDRRRLGAEDRARGVDDRAQQVAIAPARRRARRRPRLPADRRQPSVPADVGGGRVQRRSSPGTASAPGAWRGRARRCRSCAASRSCSRSTRIVAPPSHATSTSSAAREELDRRLRVVEERERVVELVAAHRDDRGEPPRIALDRHVVRGGDEHDAAKICAVGDLVQRRGVVGLRRREAHVDRRRSPARSPSASPASRTRPLPV